MTTPLSEPKYYLASNGRLMQTDGDVDCTGKQLTIYTKPELKAYGAAEYERGTDALQAMTAERDALRAAAKHMTEAIMHAYGHLWHVNTEPMAPIPLRSPEAAAYEARKILRDMLTREQRGIAINAIDLAMKGKS